MYYYLQEVRHNHGILLLYVFYSKDRGFDESKIEVEPLANRPL